MNYLPLDIIKGEAKWPVRPEDRDILYFLAQSFRAKLLPELPESKLNLGKDGQHLVHRAKSLIKELSLINYEIFQDLPRLAAATWWTQTAIPQ